LKNWPRPMNAAQNEMNAFNHVRNEYHFSLYRLDAERRLRELQAARKAEQ
jgi:hypothetical protein